MALKKLQIAPGINKENTQYTNEGKWWSSNCIRFRQGTPEKIGGWRKVISSMFGGVCRSLFSWVSLKSIKLTGIGTHTGFYVETGGSFYNITPLRPTHTATNPFTTTEGSPDVRVYDPSSGVAAGDVVSFSGASLVGGIDMNIGEWYVATASEDGLTYTVFPPEGSEQYATSSDTGGGTVTMHYPVAAGLPYSSTVIGWGGSVWGSGSWGTTIATKRELRLWSQGNFGEDLVLCPRGGSVYYWYTAIGTDERAINITDIPVDHVLSDPFTTSTGTPTVTVADPYHNALVGDSVAFSGATAVGGLTIAGSYSVATVVDATAYTITAGSNASSTATGGGVVTATYAYNNTAPTKAEFVVVSDVFRFLLAFGCNDLGSTDADPMLIRWANQETVTDWYPSATNQAGSLRLSRGSKIVAAVQMKQEILVLTDSAAYSLQYLGAPAVWGATLLADNISIQGMNAVTVASGVAYWMGINKFYMYNGTVSTLPSDLRQYVFGDFNLAQGEQTFAGSNERFNEVWWFYCVDGKYFNTKYVVFNYIENAWYYGDLSRTAWLDSNVQDYPIAAYGPLLSEFDPDLYPANVFDEYLLYHELGVDDESGDTPAPINAFVESGEFDIDDGDHFGFVYRILPDLTFRGSTADNPSVTMTLYPMKNSGSGYGESVAGSENATVTRSVSVPVEEFTGQVFVRVRGRQMVLRIESNTLGVAWQLGSPRIDIRQDGRR